MNAAPVHGKDTSLYIVKCSKERFYTFHNPSNHPSLQSLFFETRLLTSARNIFENVFDGTVAVFLPKYHHHHWALNNSCCDLGIAGVPLERETSIVTFSPPQIASRYLTVSSKLNPSVRLFSSFIMKCVLSVFHMLSMKRVPIERSLPCSIKKSQHGGRSVSLYDPILGIFLFEDGEWYCCWS